MTRLLLMGLFSLSPVLVTIGCLAIEKAKPQAEKASIEMQRVERHIVDCQPESRILRVLLLLRNDTYAADLQIVNALASLTWFNKVLFEVPSVQEKPGAADHSIVKRGVMICKRLGIDYGWGRRLWVAWPPKGSPSTVGAEYEPIHYALAISTVVLEAKSMGASFTFLDAEPYGKSPQMESMKRHHYTKDERTLVAAAVFNATAAVGFVDMIYPASSSDSPWHFAWPMQLLAVLRCDAKTYWSKAPDYRTPNIVIPAGFTWRVDLWGSIVGVPQHRKTGTVILNSDDVKALDLETIKKKHQNCQGFWVVIPHKQLAKAILDW